MLSATHVIPFISFFIAMSQSPIEVDLTDDTPSHWTTQGATTPPAGTTAAAEFPTCAICLQDIHRTAIGPNAPYDWPACSHPIHLSCAMQHMSHQAQPACPTCRQQWTQDGQYRLEQVGQTTQFHGWYPKPPTTPGTSTPNHPQPPTSLSSCVAPGWPHQPPPPGAGHILAGTPNKTHGMGPNSRPHQNEWQPEWVCLRCNTAVTPKRLERIRGGHSSEQLCCTAFRCPGILPSSGHRSLGIGNLAVHQNTGRQFCFSHVHSSATRNGDCAGDPVLELLCAVKFSPPVPPIFVLATRE